MNTIPSPIKAFNKGKWIASDLLRGWKERSASSAMFQVDYPNQRTLTIREVEEIQAIEEKTIEEDHTLVTLDVGELLVILRALHVKAVPLEFGQRKRIFHTRCTIGGKVCEFIIDLVIAPMWLL